MSTDENGCILEEQLALGARESRRSRAARSGASYKARTDRRPLHSPERVVPERSARQAARLASKLRNSLCTSELCAAV